MTKTTPTCDIAKITSTKTGQATTLNLRPVPISQTTTFNPRPVPISQTNTLAPHPAPISQAITRTLRPISKDQCSCRGDGTLAFILPWMAITALGAFTTMARSDSDFVFQAVLPGLMAGASGLILYKAAKRTVQILRRMSIQMAQ